MPESPRYLIFKGEEEKAKKVLTLVAKINCSRLIPGRLVTQEVKENILKERSNLKASNGAMESSFTEVRRQPSSAPNYGSTYGALSGQETPPLEEEAFNDGRPAIDMSDIRKLLKRSRNRSIEDCDKCSWFYLKKLITYKLVNYYHWILILFNNGWWRTTLLLWFLW